MANRELSCRLVDEDDNVVGDIPDFIDVQIQDQLNDPSAWQMHYDRKGRRATQLIQDGDCYIQFFLGGTKLDFEGVIEQDNWDEVDDKDYIKLAGRGHAGQFEYALVYPKNGVGTKPAEWSFTNATPGRVFRDLFFAAQSRGALPGFTVDFTDTHDSDGNAWNHTITLTYKAGVNLLDVLNNFGSGGYADYRMQGKKLRMYNPRTVLGGQTGVVFRRGRDIVSAPRSRDRRNIGTSWLLEGDEGVTLVRTDETAVAARGLKERYLSQGGTKDPGTLAVIGDTQLSVYANARFQKTHKLRFDPEGTSPIPWISYIPGEYVDTDLTGQLENYRLIAMNISMGSSGVLEGEVTLNDIFAERQLLLDEKIKTLTGGSAGGGVSTQPPTQTPPEDTTTPVAPDNLNATSDQYDVPGGVKYSQITATWQDVTQNTDGSVYDDHDHYELQWWYSALPDLKYNLQTTINVLSWSSLRPGEEVSFHVRAVDVNGHRSAYSAPFEITTADDTTPPPKPSDPVVSNWLGTLRVQWNGLGDAGEVMPLDFKHVEVWYSPNAAFVPGDVGSVLYDYLPAKGASIISGLNYNTPYYVRFVAEDTRGNRSTASDVASGTTKQVVGTDVGGNVIDFSNIRFKDVGNLVPDGSFELPETDAIISPAVTTAYKIDVVTNPDGATAAPSPKVLEFQDGGSASSYVITGGIPCSPGQKITMIFSHKSQNLAGTDSAVLQIKFNKSDGTSQFIQWKTWGSGTNNPTWTLREAAVQTVPANAVNMDILVRSNITSGPTARVWVDQWEVRFQAGTALIEDAAITNAKIGLLAVNDANIGNVNVGKLVAGTLTADVTLSSRIKTANTGARVELNSGGFGAWNASGVQTVAIAGADGSVNIIGQLRSGSTGQRIEINPTATLLPEIRFYPSSGANYGFLNGFSPSGSASVFMGLNSGQFAANGQTCAYRLYMAESMCSLETIRSDLQTNLGGAVEISPTTASMYVITTAERQGFIDLYGGGGQGTHQVAVSIGHNGTSDNDDAWLNVYKDGSLDMIGTWYRSAGWANGGIEVDTTSSSSTVAGFLWNWATTKNSTVYPCVQYRDNPGKGTALDSLTTSGWGFNIDGGSNGACAINWWGWR
ncbi:hypothetical protein GCM10010423_65090 [Streptomyces levis]|uniref:Fibronectin type-III domain-containing protein n=1 Tax=Streptomyces levis TaxID=285566 RepID=A0ABN3P192_9ACTN